MQYEIVQLAKNALLRVSSEIVPSIKQFVAFALLPLLAFSTIPQLKHEAPRISMFDWSDSLIPVGESQQLKSL